MKNFFRLFVIIIIVILIIPIAFVCARLYHCDANAFLQKDGSIIFNGNVYIELEKHHTLLIDPIVSEDQYVNVWDPLRLFIFSETFGYDFEYSDDKKILVRKVQLRRDGYYCQKEYYDEIVESIENPVYDTYCYHHDGKYYVLSAEQAEAIDHVISETEPNRGPKGIDWKNTLYLEKGTSNLCLRYNYCHIHKSGEEYYINLYSDSELYSEGAYFYLVPAEMNGIFENMF